MPTWLIFLIAIPAGLALLLGGLLLATARPSRAGIVTTRLGRTVRLVASGLRLSGRFIARKARYLVVSRQQREAVDRRYHEETARAIVDSMGQMKGVLMKLGQIVSFMDETLPEAYQGLRVLQAQAPPMAYDIVAHVIRDDLGRDPELLFETFEREPLAAASIGQVHRATLLDGTRVAVKVQYPGVAEAIRSDLNNYGMLMGMLQVVAPNIDAKPIVDELKARILEEVDYHQEARNQEEMRALFAGHRHIVIPRVVPNRSSARVLTTEYVEGQTFYSFLDSATAAEKRQAVLTLRDFVFDALWHHHVFNGDPHPGNYIFLPDNRIAFIDFGCVKRFDPTFMQDFRVLNRAYLTGDVQGYFAKARDMHFISPGHEHRVTPEWLWDYARWFYLPILEDAEFTFTPEYCKKALGQLFGENMKRLNMPPEYVVLNRITFGLNSILSHLGACENWRRLSKPYYFPDEVDPVTGV